VSGDVNTGIMYYICIK